MMNARELILCILLLNGGYIKSITRLMITSYLFVLQSKNVKNIEFKAYYYGPFSQQIDEELNKLEKENLIETKLETDEDDKYYHIFCLTNKGIKIGVNTLMNNINNVKILKEIIDETSDFSLMDILDCAYSTHQFVETEFGNVIEL